MAFRTWKNSVSLSLGAGALLLAASQAVFAQDGAVPNLSGMYSQNRSIYFPPAQGGTGPLGDLPGHERQNAEPWVGNHLHPMLQPHTAAEVERLSQLELSGGVNLTSYQLCKLLGVPLILTQRDNMQLLQEEDKVTIIYQRDQQIRHVYLNVAHSENVTPTWYGESVGHYEGDVLVVDTIGQTDQTRVDRYGSYSSETLHVTERYFINDEGALQVDFTVTDPATFTMPWNGTQIFRPSDEPWEMAVCAENNRDAATGDAYVGMPMDLTPDF